MTQGQDEKKIVIRNRIYRGVQARKNATTGKTVIQSHFSNFMTSSWECTKVISPLPVSIYIIQTGLDF